MSNRIIIAELRNKSKDSPIAKITKLKPGYSFQKIKRFY